MYRRMTVLVARRLAMALVAAVGAATALLVASPPAPAHAAGAAHPTSTAATAAPTMSFTAHAAAGGAITPFSSPLDITCTLTAFAPTPRGADFVHSDVFGEAFTTCHFDINGLLAPVSLIDMSEQLRL